MKKILFTIMTLALVMTLGLGCGQSQTPASPTTTTVPQSQTTPATSVATTPAPATTSTPATAVATPAPTAAPTQAATGTLLQDLVSKANWQQSFSCDMVVTSDAGTMNASMAIKNNNMRMKITAEGQEMIWLANADEKTAYMINEEAKTGMKFPFDQYEAQTADIQGPGSYLEANVEDAKYIGTETVDGKECAVYEYTVSEGTTKMWLWKDTGFPLKIEVTADGATVDTIEYKNVTVGDIPDSLFELPADIEIMDMGNLNIPGMPSPEE